MHESIITQNLLDTVLDKAKAAKAKKITRIHVIIGELSGVASNCVQFYFDVLKKDTAAAEAVIDFTTVTAKLQCRDCRTEFHPEDTLWICPKCGSYSVDIKAGRDCTIESIEVEP